MLLKSNQTIYVAPDEFRNLRIDPLMWVVLLVEHQKAIEDDDQGVITAEVSRKKRSITATMVRLLAVGSNSKREGKNRNKRVQGERARGVVFLPFQFLVSKRQLDVFSFNEPVNVYEVQTLHAVMAGNLLANESRILSQECSQLKNDVVSLKRKNGSLKHELSKLEDNLFRAQNNHDVEGSQITRDSRSDNARVLEELLLFREVAIVD
nr:hypothetical protein [Tanacetum cinerariifolium]